MNCNFLGFSVVMFGLLFLIFLITKPRMKTPTLIDLPNDALDTIIEFMDIFTFASFRRVHERAWYANQIKQHAIENIKRIEEESSAYPEYGLALLFQRKPAYKCAHCQHAAISFVEWKCGYKKRWIPWCPLHVPAQIMDEVECYCLGGIS